MRIRSTVGIGTVALVAISAAGCGGSDDAKPAAGAQYTLGQACTVTSNAGAQFSSALMPWLYPSTADRTDAPSSGIDALQYLKSDDKTQQQLKSDAEKLTELTTQVKAAIAAKDDAKVRQLRTDAKAPFDSIINTCKDVEGWDSKQTSTETRKMLDQEPMTTGAAPSAGTPSSAAPSTTTSAAPVALTPKGSTVKVGQPVVFDYSDDGKTDRFTLAVTEIHKASDSEVSKLEPDLRKEAKQIYFIKAELNIANAGRISEATPQVDQLYPQYSVTASNNVSPSEISLFGSFAPCRNENATGVYQTKHYCSLWAVPDDSASVTGVSVLGFSPTDRATAPLYTWKP